jgi:hypothetical protein
MTSIRENPGGHGESQNVPLVSLTVVGTVISLAGFAIQFVDLRGLNWTASIAQLGAVVSVTAIRIWVRRGLAKPPCATPLTADFELEWFALSLMDLNTASWRRGVKSHTGRGRRQSYEVESEESSYTWTIHSGQFRSYQEFKPLAEFNPGSILSSAAFSHSVAQQVLRTRKQLGDLADWRGPAADEAVRLAKAIEIVAKTLLPSDSNLQFVGLSQSDRAKSHMKTRTTRYVFNPHRVGEVGMSVR